MRTKIKWTIESVNLEYNTKGGDTVKYLGVADLPPIRMSFPTLFVQEVMHQVYLFVPGDAGFDLI